MLHILLLILKFIGIIIAAILGILVLLICIVLFVPVRYEVQSKCGGSLDSLKGKARVTWFLHLFCTDVYYKEGRFKWHVRFVFFSRSSGSSPGSEEAKEKIKKADTRKEEGDQDEKEQKISDEELEKDEEKLEEITAEEAVEERTEEIKVIESSESNPEKSEKMEETYEETCREASAADKGSEENEEPAGEKGPRILQKVKALCEKIKCTFENFCGRIKLLTEKKDKLVGFVNDEMHRKAFFRVKKEVFWFFGKLKPGKVQVKVRYGFEDPYHTGKVLAGLSMLYPFLGGSAEIIPDFEHKVLKGSLYVKGHIRLSYLAYLAWKLFWDRNIRQSYKDIKNFEL